MRVLLTKEVKLYFLELIELLYEKDYFSFEDAAFDYVNDLVRDITASLPRKLRKKAPPYFDKYGRELYYAVYRKNRNTQWYVFFQYENGIYLVRYIGNNHSISQYL
jgi:hypothetical protein